MRKRTRAREYALQMLYAIDIISADPSEYAAQFWTGVEEVEPDVKLFAEKILKGVSKNRGSIDALISKYATNWDLGRMAVIDRNVLRSAIYELIYLDDVPSKVSINEAIDIAKKFGDKDSGKFVNGILDKINKTEGKDKA